MLILDRFSLNRVMRRQARAQKPRWSVRRRSPDRRLERLRLLVLAVCGIGIAATAGWMLAGGVVGVGENLPPSEILFGQSEPAAVTSSRGTPIHIASSPVGAQVRIDGATAGKTPLDVRLESGQHTLSLRHSEALDDERTLQVGDTATNVEVDLWRRRADVVPIRPVYPGASLLDARFLDDGQVALVVGLPPQSGTLNAKRELWLLAPATGRLARLEIPGVDSAALSIVLAPEGDQVAYVMPGSTAPFTVAGWSMGGTATNASSEQTRPESVWLASLDGSWPPRRIFELPSTSTPAVPADAERIVDLAWTPDGSALIVITRQAGPPARARLLLLDVLADGDSQAGTNELVLLPAEVLPESAVPDPSSRWLALVTRAALAPGGSNVLSLCVLELRPGGTFRDIADLGSGAAVSAAAPVAWPPEGGNKADRLAFVGPAPAPPSASGGPFGIFDIFGALRPSAPPSRLFIADLKTPGLADAQPRRLGTAINNFGLVWRFETTLLGFARQDDGTLVLHSIDPTSGAVHDLGVRLSAGTAQGTTRLSARWDARHGSALLLARAPDSGSSGARAGGGPLQAWLVSFVSSSSPSAMAH